MEEWQLYEGSWCNCVDLSSRLQFSAPDDPDWIAAAKAACASMGYKGFSNGGKKIYFIPAAVTREMSEPFLETGRSSAVYTYWLSTAGVWQCHDGLWCIHACTSLPFDFAVLGNDPCVAAAKVLCELKGHMGFSYGGTNIFFIPGQISDSQCEEELEDGLYEYVYTCVRSGWHMVDQVMVQVEEPDVLMIENTAC